MHLFITIVLVIDVVLFLAAAITNRFGPLYALGSLALATVNLLALLAHTGTITLS